MSVVVVLHRFNDLTCQMVSANVSREGRIYVRSDRAAICSNVQFLLQPHVNGDMSFSHYLSGVSGLGRWRLAVAQYALWYAQYVCYFSRYMLSKANFNFMICSGNCFETSVALQL